MGSAHDAKFLGVAPSFASKSSRDRFVFFYPMENLLLDA